MAETYRKFCDLMLECWPSLFRDEGEALEQMFFVIGNGLEWVKGGLTDGMSPKKRLAAAMKHRKPGETHESIRKKDDKYRDSCIREFGKKGTWYKLPDGSYGRQIYPLCEFSRIMQLPDDIRPDWLEAAKAAVTLARSERCKLTASDKKCLSHAEVRIQDLSRAAGIEPAPKPRPKKVSSVKPKAPKASKKKHKYLVSFEEGSLSVRASGTVEARNTVIKMIRQNRMGVKGNIVSIERV